MRGGLGKGRDAGLAEMGLAWLEHPVGMQQRGLGAASGLFAAASFLASVAAAISIG